MHPEGATPRGDGDRTGLHRVTNDLAFGLLYAVFNMMATELFSLDIGGSSEVTQTATYFDQLWTFLPFIILLMLIARLVARAAFESRGGV
jgi:hypothetical protein